MAFPIIRVHHTGSDNNSGAGPGDGVTSGSILSGTTNASFSGATVTLPSGTDLTNVDTTGLHCIYIVTSTGVRFFKITAKAGSGGATPTLDITPNPAGTSTARTWAVGGKRASVGSSSSRLLFKNADSGSSVGDWKGGWVCEMADGHAETISSTLEFFGDGSTTDGPMRFRGESGATTKPVLSYSGSSFGMEIWERYHWFEDFDLLNTGTGDYAIVVRQRMNYFRNVKVSGSWSQTAFFIASGPVLLESCEMHNTGRGVMHVSSEGGCKIIACRIHGCSSNGIELGTDGGGLIYNNEIYDNAADGITSGAGTGTGYRSWYILHNTIHDNGGDGIDQDQNETEAAGSSVMINNIFTNNGAYGVAFVATAEQLEAGGARIMNNVFGSGGAANTSGGITPTGVDEGSVTIDPDYVNAAAGDFTPQEASLEGTAFPTSM